MCSLIRFPENESVMVSYESYESYEFPGVRRIRFHSLVFQETTKQVVTCLWFFIEITKQVATCLVFFQNV
jgi:hypothetical protein